MHPIALRPRLLLHPDNDADILFSVEPANRYARFAPFVLDLALFLAGGLILLTASAFPTDWDSCQFVLGMTRFCPPDHQPHPPGYYCFLYFAQMTKAVSGAGNHSALLMMSAGASALLIPAVRRLTAKLFPGRLDISIGAALLALAAPARLFFGSQALSYTWEGLFATLLISLALDLNPKVGRKNRFAWLGWLLLWALSGGFRPNLLLFLLPLALFLAVRQRWWENLLGSIVVLLVTARWLVPSIVASGGLTRYVDSVRGESSFFVSYGLGWSRLADNLQALYNTPGAVSGLHIAGWVLIALTFLGLAGLTGRKGDFLDVSHRTIILLALVPMFLFHAFLMFSLRYSLLYLPILAPVLAWLGASALEKAVALMPSLGLQRWSRSAGWAIPAVLLLVSCHAFLAGNGIHSLAHIRSLERETRHVAMYVRELGMPDSVTIIAGRQFRCWGIALPEYTIYHPMHALYPKYLNPRLAAMRNGDTIRGDFFLPGAPESESATLPLPNEDAGQIVVLDEDAYRALMSPKDGWSSERITNRENLYWRRFDTNLVLMDQPGGFSLAANSGPPID